MNGCHGRVYENIVRDKGDMISLFNNFSFGLKPKLMFDKFTIKISYAVGISFSISLITNKTAAPNPEEVFTGGGGGGGKHHQNPPFQQGVRDGCDWKAHDAHKITNGYSLQFQVQKGGCDHTPINGTGKNTPRHPPFQTGLHGLNVL